MITFAPDVPAVPASCKRTSARLIRVMDRWAIYWDGPGVELLRAHGAEPVMILWDIPADAPAAVVLARLREINPGTDFAETV